MGSYSSLAVPVSTTHTVTGTIVWAWILTIPMSAAIASLTYLAIR